MNPKILTAVTAGAAGLGYLGWKKFKTPTKEDYQTMPIAGTNGIPIKIATPVSRTITVSQATATPSRPLSVGKVGAVPTTVSGRGIVYAPPGTIATTSDGKIVQPAPIIVTPAGVASIAVGSVKDIQHALNALGYAKPPLVEDGKLGPLTIVAIRTFQQKNKLVVDGNAGPATSAALSNALRALAGGTSAVGATAQNSRPETGRATTPGGVVINTTPALTMTIKQVQQKLNLLGTSPKLVEDGKLGPKTVAAIKSFQTGHGLTPDGVVGPKTKTALYLASPSRAVASQPVLQPQTSVTPASVAAMTIKQVQQYLNVLGMASPKLVEDGKLGAKTYTAIKKFQASKGLTPDGVAGPQTKTALHLAMQENIPRIVR